MTFTAKYTHFNFMFTGKIVNDVAVFENISTPVGNLPEIVLYKDAKYWTGSMARIERGSTPDKKYPWMQLHSENEFTIHVRRGDDGKPQFQVNIIAYNYDWKSRETLELMVRNLFLDWLFYGALDITKVQEVSVAR